MKGRSLWVLLVAMALALALTASVSAQVGETITVPLGERNKSGQTGTATLRDLGSDKTEVVVSLSKGTLTSELAHFHVGSCKELGGVKHPLTNLDAAQKSTTTVGVSLATLLAGNLAINTHEKGKVANYTACGDVPARVGSAGGTLTFGQGIVTVGVPAGAVSGSVDLVYRGLNYDVYPAPAAAPKGMAFGAAVFDVSTTKAVTFSRLVNVTVKYSADEVKLAGGNPNNVNLYFYDPASKSWLKLDAAIRDVVNNTLTTQQSSLSTFAIILSGVQPTPTPTPTPAPTPTPTRTPTPKPPGVGDVAPGSGTLAGLAVVGVVLVLGGGYLFLRASRRKGA